MLLLRCIYSVGVDVINVRMCWNLLIKIATKATTVLLLIAKWIFGNILQANNLQYFVSNPFTQKL